MATHRISLFDPMHDAAVKKRAASIRLPETVRNDVFLSALLEMPTTKRARRSPLEWAGATALHIAILAALIIVPLYTTGTIRLNEFVATPLVAPPPPAPPPPAAGAVAPHVAHTQPKLTYKLQRVVAPTSIPKKVPSENVAESAPDLGGVIGGVPGGVIGGQIGGVVGGIGTSALPPPPQQRRTPKIVRAGGNLKAPRQTLYVKPEYPALAHEAHVSGTVVVDAVIDDRGNVVQARVVSGHPLLIDAALKAVLQWKYEPTSLNGQPISVELQVQVRFDLNS
jgi:periplasmic protein TonB